jgi:hypothetical protein
MFIYGRATDGTIDSDEQIVDPKFASRAMAKWFSTRGNVREMHQASAVGKGVQLVSEPDGEYVKSKIVDPVAQIKVREGVYSDYSVGISRPHITRSSKARGGIIDDGEIVELSVVDRGANYNAHFEIAKRAKNGGVEFTGKVVEDDVSKGTFTHDHSHVGPDGVFHRHPHTHAAGTPPHDEAHEGQPHTHSHTEVSVTDEKPDTEDLTPADEADKAAKCDKCKGEKTIDGAACDKCGGSGFMPADKAAAPADDDTDADAADDADATKKPFEGAAPPFGAKPKKPAKAKKVTEPTPAAPEAEADKAAVPTDEDKAAAKADKKARKEAKRSARKAATASLVKTAKDEAPWVVRRAHDASCAAYDTPTLVAAYPSIAKNGVAAALGPMTQQGLYSMLANEVAEDGGSGNQSFECLKLAKAYDALCTVLLVESSDGSDDISAAYLSARADLHAAFKQANEAEMGAGGSGPSIPAPSDPPQPGQYRRPYLTDGQAAETAVARDVTVTAPIHPVEASDFDKGPLGLAQGQQRSLSDKIAHFHDALVDWKPDLCRMDAPPPDPSGWFGSTRQPAASFQRPPSLPQIDSGGNALPTPIRLPSSAPAPGETKGVEQVSFSAEPTLRAITQADIDAAVAKAATAAAETAAAPYIAKIATLEATVDELASQGDPAQRADRGTAGFRGKSARLLPTAKEARRQAAREKRREAERQEEIDYQTGMARSGSPEARGRAIDKLARLGVSVEDL